MESMKPDYACAVQRKTPENLAAGFDATLSSVRFEGKTCEIAAVFSDSCSNAARLLCDPDCVAESLRFEPSVPFQEELSYIEVPTGAPPSFLENSYANRHWSLDL